MNTLQAVNRLSHLEQHLTHRGASSQRLAQRQVPPHNRGAHAYMQAQSPPSSQQQPEVQQPEVRSQLFDQGDPIEVQSPEKSNQSWTAHVFDRGEPIDRHHASAEAEDLDDFAVASSWSEDADDWGEHVASASVNYEAASFTAEAADPTPHGLATDRDAITVDAHVADQTVEDSHAAALAADIAALRQDVQDLSTQSSAPPQAPQPSVALANQVQSLQNEIRALQQHQQSPPSPAAESAALAQVDALRQELHKLRQKNLQQERKSQPPMETSSHHANALSESYWQTLEQEETFQGFDHKLDQPIQTADSRSFTSESEAQAVDATVVPASSMAYEPQRTATVAQAESAKMMALFDSFDQQMDPSDPSESEAHALTYNGAHDVKPANDAQQSDIVLRKQRQPLNQGHGVNTTVKQSEALNQGALEPAKINLPLSFKKRLTQIANAPWSLDRTQEGNCGFAAVIMAMLHLKASKILDPDQFTAILQAILMELVTAIHTSSAIPKSQQQKSNANNKPYVSQSKYKNLIATSRSTNQERDGKAIIQNRLDKGLAHHPSIKDVASLVEDYTLIVGLMLFYKDHVKKKNPRLWQALEKFNQLFEYEWPKTHLQDLGVTDVTENGIKKGGFGLTVEGMLALCEYLAIDAVHYTDNTISAKQRQATPLANTVYDGMYKKFLAESSHSGKGATLIDCYTNNTRKFVRADKATHAATVSWQDLPWPCLVGVYNESQFYGEKTNGNDAQGVFDKKQFKQSIPYNLLRHWIYMPDQDVAWSWGYDIDLNSQYDSDSTEYEILCAVPMEVIALGEGL